MRSSEHAIFLCQDQGSSIINHNEVSEQDLIKIVGVAQPYFLANPCFQPYCSSLV